MAKVTDTVAALALPVVEGAGCTLWDVEYVKEAGEWFLRVYIDKEGGVSMVSVTFAIKFLPLTIFSMFCAGKSP